MKHFRGAKLQRYHLILSILRFVRALISFYYRISMKIEQVDYRAGWKDKRVDYEPLSKTKLESISVLWEDQARQLPAISITVLWTVELSALKFIDIRTFQEPAATAPQYSRLSNVLIALLSIPEHFRFSSNILESYFSNTNHVNFCTAVIPADDFLAVYCWPIRYRTSQYLYKFSPRLLPFSRTKDIWRQWRGTPLTKT